MEVLYGYPLDGVVLTIGCDKTTPALLMAAATVNIPAIALSVGPMLNGWHEGERTGSGTIVWKARQMLAAGEIDNKKFVELVASSAPSTGYCNTMGTATTMNSLAEALGMQLPGSAAIPAPHRDRQEISYRTGRRIVEMVHEDLKPSDIMTKDNFINAIRVNSAIAVRPTRRSISAPSRVTSACRSTSPNGRPKVMTSPCWSIAAGRRLSRRGFLSGGWCTGGGRRTDEKGD